MKLETLTEILKSKNIQMVDAGNKYCMFSFGEDPIFILGDVETVEEMEPKEVLLALKESFVAYCEKDASVRAVIEEKPDIPVREIIKTLDSYAEQIKKIFQRLEEQF